MFCIRPPPPQERKHVITGATQSRRLGKAKTCSSSFFTLTSFHNSDFRLISKKLIYDSALLEFSPEEPRLKHRRDKRLMSRIAIPRVKAHRHRQ